MPQKEPSTPNSHYRVYKIECDAGISEVLQAFVQAHLEVEGISENDRGFDCYFDTRSGIDAIQNKLEELQQQFTFSYAIDELEQKNWNVIWESNFDPVEVESYCRIRAPFHEESDQYKHDIVIHPGMAFGTGHHQTTWMMAAHLEQLDLVGKKVLDAGCGTGVLAILAALEGAEEVDAFDFDIHSVESSQQNKVLNGIDYINVHHSDVASFEGTNYDFILANINRNVILEHLSSLYEKLAYKGMIIVSGYLEEDIDLVSKAASSMGLKMGQTLKKADWISQRFVKL